MFYLIKEDLYYLVMKGFIWWESPEEIEKNKDIYVL